MRLKRTYMTVLVILLGLLWATPGLTQWLIDPPDHGYISKQPASKWEEAMLTGNGTTGALVIGDVQNERIIISHERLFLPGYPAYDAPPLYKTLKKARKHALKGKGGKVAYLMVKAGKEVEINDMIWTDPLIPACQLEVDFLDDGEVTDYNRSVNYETGEAVTAWQIGDKSYRRSVFFSRADGIGVIQISSPTATSLNFKFRFEQLPLPDDEDDFDVASVIETNDYGHVDSKLYYNTVFKNQWEDRLKGYAVSAVIQTEGGSIDPQEDGIAVEGADEIIIVMDVKLSYELPLEKVTSLEAVLGKGYTDLLTPHAEIQSAAFNRFSLQIGEEPVEVRTSEDYVSASSPGNLQPELVNQLCEAARYIALSSSGDLPPTLQGIWGGTWRPAWSGDFTLNGNVPSAIASGMNTNLLELSEAYLGYMWSHWDDFVSNARGLYQAPGLFVPSRSSSSGNCYHYGWAYPHLYWLAGGGWTARFFYDYWLYTGDEAFLRDRAIPFMVEAANFYEHILVRDKDGKFMFVPSYSPEIGPMGQHPLAVNATMDVAVVKELMRHLLKLSSQGYLDSHKDDVYRDILGNLPSYQVDDHGDLKEWLWEGFENDNEHRHASHLYPLFYEVDPEFDRNHLLLRAANAAIDKRLAYRRENNGAEMAFGLVQKGLAAAHLGNTDYAYECVDWLCNSYWSPAFTSYHDPGEIFNVDICGGLPAVVTEMLIQSNPDRVVLLPALPEVWDWGEVKGALTRAGVTVDFSWEDGRATSATFRASRDTEFTLEFGKMETPLQLADGEEYSLSLD